MWAKHSPAGLVSDEYVDLYRTQLLTIVPMISGYIGSVLIVELSFSYSGGIFQFNANGCYLPALRLQGRRSFGGSQGGLPRPPPGD